jgi:hypothetical protein
VGGDTELHTEAYLSEIAAMFLASTYTCAVYVKRRPLFTGLAKNMAHFSKKSLTLN